jgi:hypothetical protein
MMMIKGDNHFLNCTGLTFVEQKIKYILKDNFLVFILFTNEKYLESISNIIIF